MSATAARSDAALRFSAVRWRLLGAALARIGFSAAFLLFVASGYSGRRLIWGPDGLANGDGFDAWTLYALGGSGTWFEIVFHTGILAAVAFAVVGGRALAALNAVFVWSLHNVDRQLLQPGDSFVALALLLLVLVTSNAYLSPGARGRRSRLAEQRGPSVAALVHNVGVTLLVLATGLVHLGAFLAQAGQPAWRRGTALGALAADQSLAGPWQDPIAGPVLGYLVLCAQAAFLPLVLSRRLRGLGVVGGILAAGILLAAGGFLLYAVAIVAGAAVCLTDSDYRLRTVAAPAPPQGRADPLVPPAAPARPAAAGDPAVAPPAPGTGGDAPDIDALLREVDAELSKATGPGEVAPPADPGPQPRDGVESYGGDRPTGDEPPVQDAPDAKNPGPKNVPPDEEPGPRG